MSLQKKIRDLQKNLDNETSVTRYNYDTLLDRINNLDVKLTSINNQNNQNFRRNNQNNQNNRRNRQNNNENHRIANKGSKIADDNTSGKFKPANKHKKICVFDKCPAGTGEKHKILYGQVKVADGSTMCTFKDCPNGSAHVGDMANVEGTDIRRLCVFDKCPTGSYPLASYINKKHNK